MAEALVPVPAPNEGGQKKYARDQGCSVDICTSRKLKNPELQFFCFPPDTQPERLNFWKRATNKTSLPKNCQKHACICENHFIDSDFAPILGAQYSHIQLNSAKKVLKRTAVPSKNLNPKVKLCFDALTPPKQNLVGSEIKAFHVPKFQAGISEDCTYCNSSNEVCKKKTKYQCETCNVKLCLPTCFENYHKNLHQASSSEKGEKFFTYQGRI